MPKFDVKTWIIVGTALQFLMACGSPAQEKPEPPQQRIRQVEQARMQNEQKLHRYQWIQTTTFTVDGNSRPPKQSICRYSADGTVQKTPLGQQQEAQSGSGRGSIMPLRGGGLLRKVMAEKKKEKYKNDIDQIRAVGKSYLPIDRAKLQDAFRQGRLKIERNGATDSVVINGYVKDGDQVSLTLDHSTHQLEQLTLKTYIDAPKDTLTANVQFATLEDGTRYRSLMTIDAPAKKLSVTIANGSYQLIR